jgi:hypothetical protein
VFFCVHHQWNGQGSLPCGGDYAFSDQAALHDAAEDVGSKYPDSGF